jgi:hypothetical protein
LLFDPETRRFISSVNVYFHENFNERIDALRHHDRRRELLRMGLPQPIILDDFDDPKSTAVRSLYIDPDCPPPADAPFSDVENGLESASASGSPAQHSLGKLIPSPRADAAPPSSIAPPIKRSCSKDES